MPKPPTGITARHGRACRTRNGGGCNCTPSYEAWTWDKRAPVIDKDTGAPRLDAKGKPLKGVKIRKSFRNLAEAKTWRHDAASEVGKGTMSAPTRATIEEACRSWLDGAKAGTIRKRNGAPYKPSLLRTYEGDVARYLVPALGHLRLSNLRRRDVQALVDELVSRDLSGSRVQGIVKPLRVVSRRAIENDELTVNPTANLRLPEADGRRDRVASPEEAVALLDALPEADRALWATAFYGGLRRGELRALRADDLDLDLNLIHVRRSWDDVEGEIDPKSRKGERDVPVAGTLRLHLLEHLARTGRRGCDLVFGRTASEPFTPSHVRARALKAWARAGLEPIGLHEARHTYVSLMHAAGRSLEEIGDYVGHSSAYMTDRYRHLLEGARQEAADALDAFLAKRTGAQTGAQAEKVALKPA